MATPKRRRPWPVMALAALVAGCAATSPSPREASVSAATAADIRALEAVDDYAGAARRYLNLTGTPSELREWRLRAAEMFRRGNDLPRAMETLDPLDGALLNTDQRARVGIIRADAALAAGQPEDALNELPNLTPEIGGERRIEILTLRVAAYQGVNSNVDAMLDALQLQRLVSAPEERRAVENTIWDLMDTSDPEQLQSLASLDPSLPGWIVLHDVATISLDQQDEFDLRMGAWQRDYPSHPGAERAAHLSRARRNPEPPARVALLLPMSGRFGPAAEEVRDGFLLGNFLAPEPRSDVRVYDISGRDPAEAYLLATREGADLVVGPLLKENVEKLTQLDGREVPLLALNRVGGPRRLKPTTAIAADEIPAETTLGNPTPGLDGLPPGGDDQGEAFETAIFEPPQKFADGATVYQFGLAPEDDAEEIARRARAEGVRRALILHPQNDWGFRIEQSFTSAFKSGGGFVASASPYDPSAADFSEPIQQILHLDTSEERRRALEQRLSTRLEFEPRRRQDVDLIVLAARPNHGRQVYPQLRFYHLGDLATWATATLYTGTEDPVRDRDLDGVEFTDIPWLFDRGRLDPDLRGDDVVVDPAMLNSRLFALGLDAYRLMPWLPALSSAQGLSINGATGRLTVDPDGVVHRRDLVWARFEEGIARPLGNTSLELRPPTSEQASSVTE